MDPPPTSTKVDIDTFYENAKKKNFYCKGALIILFLALFAGAVAFAHFKMQPFSKKTTETSFGTSKGYLKAALNFHNSVNKSTNPCDDFFEHACGTYIKNNPIPPHLQSYDEFSRMAEDSTKNMKTLLESPEKYSSSAINKMKSIYNACLKEEDYAPKAPQAALDALKKYGSWPLLEGDSNWDPSSFDLQELSEKVSNDLELGIPGFNFRMARDLKDKNLRILMFDQKPLLANDEYFLAPEKFENEWKAIRKLLISKLTQFSKDIGIAVNPRLEQELEDIFAFQTKLAHIMKRRHERRDTTKLYNPRPFKQFNVEFKRLMNFDLKKYALATSHPLFLPLINDEDAIISLFDPEYPQKLADIMKAVDPKILKNLIMLSVFEGFEFYMGQTYRDIQFEYNKELLGIKEQKPWWKTCNGLAEEMSKAYGALYARNYFDQESKASMEVMITNLKSALKEIIHESTWMDDSTKSKATKKVEEQISLIGYSKYAFDDNLLDEYYEKLDIVDADTLLEYKDKSRIFSKFKGAEEFMKPVDRKTFFSNAAVVNAYFRPTSNAILFPAAILQFPFFDKDQPVALNYGAIGGVIGHEITHGFDDNGKNFDDQGGLTNWWSDATLKKYQEKAQCMIDQYSAVEVPETGGMHINGKLTAGENIADNGGIREAYRAYQKYLADNGPELSLPGIDATNDQLFFYGYANSWCSNIRPGVLKNRLLSDNHSPARSRVNVVIQNTAEFSKAFNCPVGSPMNPQKKCAVW